MNTSFEVLVERRLKMQALNGNVERDLVVQIGKPYPVLDEGDAACPVAMHGLVDRIADIHGIDAMHALRLAIEFVESVIRDKTSEFNFSWPDGEEYVPPKRQ